MPIAQWLGPKKVNWVVAGPELGEYARPYDFEWIRDLQNQCIIAGVPFFTKHLIHGREVREYPDG
jgi:protein gp37